MWMERERTKWSGLALRAELATGKRGRLRKGSDNALIKLLGLRPGLDT